MMTLEERERRAYANGQVERASILREAIDVESERVLDLDYEVRGLKEEVETLEAELAEALDPIEIEARCSTSRLLSPPHLLPRWIAT